MKNIIFFLTILILNFDASCQNGNSEEIYIMIDNEKYSDLYILEKHNDYAKIKILHFDTRNEGFKVAKKAISENEMIAVEAEPFDTNYYEFRSMHRPKAVSDIQNLKIYSIKEVSKEDKNVWRQYPYKLYFIEKLKYEKYNVWEMNCVIQE